MTLRIGLLCFCLLTLTAKAQYNPFHVPKNLPNRDSLKAIIQTTKDPIQKLDALRELGHAYYENKRDSALFFFEQSVATAKQINSRLWEADAFNSLGFVSYILGNYPRALQFLNQAKTIAEDPNSEKGEWRLDSMSVDELKAAVRAFSGSYVYAGNYTIEDTADVVKHERLLTTIHSPMGSTVRRAFSFSGDTIILHVLNGNRRLKWIKQP